MNENKNLKLALNLIAQNKISTAIEVLRESKNIYTLKVLGLLFCVYGDFEKAYSIFFNLKDRDETIGNYLVFLEKTIKSDYIPKYNHLIELIQKNQDSKEIKNIFIDLEKISPNVELYNIATLFYLSKNNIKEAYNYYLKLNKMDSSFKNIDKFETLFKNQKLQKRLKVNYGVGVLLLLIGAFFINNNLKLGKNLTNEKDKIINLEKEIKIVKEQNEKLVESNESVKTNQSNEKKVIVEKVFIEKEEEELFTNNEIYNLALKRYRENKYDEVLKICEKVKDSQLPEYKAKELLFIKGVTYEKLLQKDLALKSYEEFLEKYNRPQYKEYIKIVKQKIVNLKKEI